MEVRTRYASVLHEMAARQEVARIAKTAAAGKTVPVRSHLLATTAQTHPADRRR